jgi:hypothetical protein
LTINGKIEEPLLNEASSNIIFAASKLTDAAMMDATRKMALHGTNWTVSVPENIDLPTFASLDFDMPISEEAKLSLSIAKR